MAPANPRPRTSRKTSFTPPSAKPTGVKKRNTKSAAANGSPASTKKGNNKTTTAKPSSAYGNKRKTKAEVDKVKKPRATPGTAGTRKKQKVDNTVDNSEVIDVGTPNENPTITLSDLPQLSEDPAPQSLFGDQQQPYLSRPFETPMQRAHEQLGALQQLASYHMGPQQPMSAMIPRQRLMQSQQYPMQMSPQQHTMPPQQRPMPPQQRPVPLQQRSSKVISQSPPAHMLPQQPSVRAQQHLSSIRSQQHPMPHSQSTFDALPEHLPWSSPLQQRPIPSQSQPANMSPQEQPMHIDQHMSDILPQQSSMHSQQDLSNLSPGQLSMAFQQVPTTLSPLQHSSNMKVQPSASVLDSQRRSPPRDSQQPSPDVSLQQDQYVLIASHLAGKIDPDFLNLPPSTIFDQLVLIMVKQDPTLSLEHNIEAVTSAQLDKCSYALWNECLFLREGQLIVHAAQYGSMYQDVKIRALGLMNLLPGWWFLREKVKSYVRNSGKWVDDKDVESQFSLACARAEKILKSRARNKKEEEKDDGLGDFEVKKDELENVEMEYCYV